MSAIIKLPENCSNAVLQEGRRLLNAGGYLSLPITIQPDGGILLKAKISDAFNFVDHPAVELDSSWRAVAKFRCDCLDYLENRGFCAHCAAVIQDLTDSSLVIQSEDTSLEEEETTETTDSRNPEEREAAEGEPQEPELPCLREFSYKFCNSRWDLYPGVRSPRIPLERYHQAFGKTAYARMLFRRFTQWGGSCYGMSATAGMFRQGNEKTSLSDFNAKATMPSELQLTDCNQVLNMTLHQYIELMHVLQFSQSIIIENNQNLQDPKCLRMLALTTKGFQNGRCGPAIMCVFKSSKFDGGHAVLPFRLESISDTEEVLHIYDPNYPMKTRYAYLQKDEQGNYLNWRFPMSDHDTYSAETGGQLSMTPYEVYQEAWNNRANSKKKNLLSLLPGVAVKNTEGELLLRVTEMGVESCRKDIYQIPVMDGGDDSAMISLPAGAYVFCLEDIRQNELSVQMAGTDLSVEVTTAAREALVQVEDESMVAAVRIPQVGAPYTIEILNTAGQTEEEMVLNGVTCEEKLHLLQKDGQLYADGLTERCVLLVNDVRQSLDLVGRLTQQEEQEEQETEMVLNKSAEDKKENEED